MTNTKYTTKFVVMPTDTNYMSPLIFGGALFSQMDLAAAGAIKHVLQHTDTICDNAVTHKCELVFLAPSYLGDTIELEACINMTGKNTSLGVNVNAFRIPHTVKNPERIHIATAQFVFVTRKGGNYHAHDLQLSSMTDIVTRNERIKDLTNYTKLGGYNQSNEVCSK